MSYTVHASAVQCASEGMTAASALCRACPESLLFCGAADDGAAGKRKAAAKARRSKQQNPLEDGHLDLGAMAQFLEDAERQAAGSDEEDEGFGAEEDEDEDEGSGSDEDLEGALGGYDVGSEEEEEDDEMQVRRWRGLMLCWSCKSCCCCCNARSGGAPMLLGGPNMFPQPLRVGSWQLLATSAATIGCGVQGPVHARSAVDVLSTLHLPVLLPDPQSC